MRTQRLGEADRRRMMEIGYCFDCNELNYAMTNANGNFERANMSFNHVGHRQYVFGKPKEYSPPIRTVLTKLQSGLPISNNEIVLFRLAIQLGDLDKFINEKAKEDTQSVH